VHEVCGAGRGDRGMYVCYRETAVIEALLGAHGINASLYASTAFR
jgi:hypothetical protein